MKQVEVYLCRVRLDIGGYDHNGRYFGRGRPLFYYEFEDDTSLRSDFFRALSHKDAKEKILSWNKEKKLFTWQKEEYEMVFSGPSKKGKK